MIHEDEKGDDRIGEGDGLPESGSLAAQPRGAASMYDLHTLGWRDFQSLCGSVLREVFGQTFQQFAESGDAGRDGAFHGKWTLQDGEELSGSFVFQCKFLAKPGAVLRPSHLSEEIDKARRLARKGLCRNYVILTNASLRGPVEEELRHQFLSIRGIKEFRAYGGEWITDTIRHHQRLRTLVPRVYGLGDLTEILDERVYEQAKEILTWFGDELERFVVTDSHHKSVKALREKGFVFLLGDPGSGKSTIAAALALAAADTWKSRVIKICNPDDFKNGWNPREPDQFFWVDDAFGQRQYERDRTLQWNHLLPHLSAALKRGARAIFTSRSYIYRAAVDDLKEALFPLLTEARVVIEVEKLTQREREQILYNHLRLGGQLRAFRTPLKPFLSDVAAHDKFLPETARRLGNPMFTKKVRPKREPVMHFVEYPEEYLRDVIQGLGDANRAALGLTFMKGGRIRARLELSHDESDALSLLNSSVGEVRKSIGALEGSLIVREVDGGETFYRFKHPTIRDAFGAFIGEDPNLMDIYLRGTRPAMLLEEITCGDVGLEGVKLVVPPDRYRVVLDRLRELDSEPDSTKQIVSFLASRCTSAFVKVFLDEHAGFVKSISLRRWLVWSQEAKLFAFLHKHELLPEIERKRFVRFANRAVMQTPEWRFMSNAEIKAMFRSSELRSLRATVRKELSSTRLNEEAEAYEEGWKESEDDPSDYFWGFKHELQAFKWEFYKNRTLRRRFATAESRLEKRIERLKKASKDKDGDLEATKEDNKISSRSIFEDVDA